MEENNTTKDLSPNTPLSISNNDETYGSTAAAAHAGFTSSPETDGGSKTDILNVSDSNPEKDNLNLSPSPARSRPPSSATFNPNSSHSSETKDKKDDSFTISSKAMTSSDDASDKARVTPSISPIKGKASPKPHVIKVTEKKNSKEDTKLEPTKAIGTKSQGNTKNSNNSNNNNDQNTTVVTNEDETSKNSTMTSEKQRNSPEDSHYTEDNRGLIEKDLDPSCSDNPENVKTSDIAGDVCRVFGVLFALGVRGVMLAFCAFTVWLVVYRMENNYYYLLFLTFIFFILEAVNIVITRAGQERKWFCLCFLCYLISAVPCIWILEMDRLDAFQSAVSNSSVAVDVAGVTANIKLDPNTLLAVTEQCLIFLLILCRWLLPRGDITRDQLSQLLFVYIGMASDVMELFTLFDESNVRQDRTLTFVILGVWTLSLLQFTMVLTMSRNPKKIRTALDHDDETNRMKKKRLKDTGFILVLTQSELWSLCVSIFMQDGPFLAVRLYAMVRYDLINYTIIFFTCKNILVILLLLYRVMILVLEKWEKSKNAADDDDNSSSNSKQGDSRYRSKTVSTRLSLSDVEDEKRPSANNSGNDGFGSSPASQQQGIRARHANQVSPA